MKITKNQIKQLIKEELGKAINEVYGQYSVGADVEKETDAGTISASGDLPLYGIEGGGLQGSDELGVTGVDPLELAEPTGPRLSAGYSTKLKDVDGLPGDIGVGGKLAMTTGGKAPSFGGEVNLTKDINDYTFKVRRTFGDYDLSKGLTGDMVGASFGKDLGGPYDAYVTAGLDMPKGENGLPSIKQTQAFLQGGGDLASLSVIIGPDSLQTGPGINFQLNAIEIGKKLGLLKNNKLEETTLKRWKKLING